MRREDERLAASGSPQRSEATIAGSEERARNTEVRRDDERLAASGSPQRSEATIAGSEERAGNSAKSVRVDVFNQAESNQAGDHRGPAVADER